MEVIFYNKLTRTFSVGEPFIKPFIQKDQKDSYRVIYKDMKSSRVGSRNLKSETPTKAMDKFKSADDVKNRQTSPTRAKAFKLPQQADQAEMYKARLKQEDKNTVQKKTIITQYGNSSN